MTALDLDAIEQRVNGATPGPWTAHAEDIFYPNDDEEHGPVSSLLGGGEAGHLDDAEFMAHARQDVPALVAEVRAWRALGAMLPEVIETAGANASSAAAEFNVTREDHEATAREYAALDALTAALEALS